MAVWSCRNSDHLNGGLNGAPGPARRPALPVLLLTPLMALSLAPALHSAADEPQNKHDLRPYEATYKTSTRGLNLTLERSLEVDKDGVCRLTSEGRLLVAGISEISVFDVDGASINPRSYVYQLSGPVSRRREVHFDPGSDYIRSLYKKEWYELPNEPGTLDRMSQQEQLRLLLLNDDTPQDNILFRVADGRKVKEYLLRFDSEETLDTPMGPVETLRFERDHDDPERRSAFWVAPSWDYLMVRTVHVEDGRTTEANLVSASIAGEPLLAASEDKS